MITRVRLAGAAILLLVLNASAGRAQQPDSVLTKREGALPGRGSVGAQIGGSWFVAEKDYSEGAQPRFSFAGHFRYVAGPHWQWQVSPYMTWAAYRVGSNAPFVDSNFPNDRQTKDFYLTQIVGGSAQIQRVGGSGRNRWHLGVGPALYRVVVQDHRKVLKDPVTKRLHQGQYLGASAEFGIERFLKNLTNTSVEWTLAGHTAFAKRDDQFPSGFNGMPAAAEFRVGVHYYFEMNRTKRPDAGRGARR